MVIAVQAVLHAELHWTHFFSQHPTFYLQMERIGRVSWVHDSGWLNASPENIFCRANVSLNARQNLDLQLTYARLDFLLHHHQCKWHKFHLKQAKNRGLFRRVTIKSCESNC
jgi:hypothetical protein